MKQLIYIILFLVSGCSSLDTNEPVTIEPVTTEKDDIYALFSSLLSINENRLTYTDTKGNTHADQLALFQEMENIYARNITPQQNGTYNTEQVKVIMFFTFYAMNRNAAAFNEFLASDLQPIYAQNTPMFLSVMRELPFLIPSVCERLNAFFGFEGNEKPSKQGFITQAKIDFETYLTHAQINTCLAQFNE